MASFKFSARSPANRKNTTYEATAPDGSILRHATFLTDKPTAWMRIVLHRDGVWRPSVIKPEKEDWEIRAALKSAWVECRKCG